MCLIDFSERSLLVSRIHVLRSEGNQGTGRGFCLGGGGHIKTMLIDHAKKTFKFT